MKTNIRSIFILAVGLVLFSACQEGEISKGHGRKISHVSANISVQTKSRNADGYGDLLFSVPVVTCENDTLQLTAYIKDTDQSTFHTKGSAITTGSLESEIGVFKTKVYGESGIYLSKDPESEEESSMDDVEVTYSGDHVWNFDESYWWPESGDSLTFCSYAPVELFTGTGALVSEMTTSADGFSFTYAQPAATEDMSDALVQKDLLFALDKQDSESNDGDVSVDFKHALTAVRFINGNLTGVVLDYIGFNNIFSSANATFTKSGFSWSSHGNKRSYRQKFSVQVDTISAGETFDKTDGEQKTFLMIPQTLPDDAEIEINVIGGLHPEIIRFSDLVQTDINGNPINNWLPYAGKTITFMISSDKVNHVSVSLDDKVETVGGKPQKNSIVIKNTGKTDCFIRLSLVGDWINSNGDILASWDESDPFGSFDNGFPTTLPSDWYKGDDGFYYYKKYLKPGAVVSQNLFNTFTLTSHPTYETGSWAGDVNMKINGLELNILVQAVEANSSLSSATTAWGPSASQLDASRYDSASE